MQSVLAFDTATESLSVAVRTKDNMAVRHQLKPRQHGELVLAWVQECCAEAGVRLADIDAIAFGRGPGAFTGVRIATGVVQGLALALQKPVYPVSSLQAMAQAVIAEHDSVIASIDARMGQVYIAEFHNQDGYARAVVEEQVIAPEAWQKYDSNQSSFFVGSGAATYQSVFAANFASAEFEAEVSFPSARAMIDAVLHRKSKLTAQPIEQLAPVYLRNNVAKKKGEQ